MLNVQADSECKLLKFNCYKRKVLAQKNPECQSPEPYKLILSVSFATLELI